MKKILLSILTIGLVSSIAYIGYSRAFFSDTQTSKDNTFQAGEIKLKIDSTQHYNGNVCQKNEAGAYTWSGNSPYPVPNSPCNGSWPLRSLTDEKFFDFTDVKPGDYGENTISMHVINNDAWACIDVSPLYIPAAADKALAAGLNFFAWNDLNCNNIFEPTKGDVKLFSNSIGPASDVLNGKTYTLAAPGLPPITGGNDPELARCIGLSWCAGKLTVDQETGETKCEGSALGNAAQGGKVKGDITFRVEQARNNPNFSCSAPQTTSPTPTPSSTPTVYDYLNIGDTASEVGHNLSDWSSEWVKPGWGGNYGGGSSDSSLRLLMGKGDVFGCQDPDARPATFTMNAGSGYATKLTLEHLDGAVNDSFEVYINNVLQGSYTASSSGGTEVWKTITFTFPGVTGTVNVKLLATQPVGSWCEDWGQVAFSNAKLE
jgi:hypothetical protein